jgi:uncharacterized OB-fold protein
MTTGVPLDVRLTYHHAHGWLSPFFEGLIRSEAMGTRCPVCGRVWCPPRRRCPDHDQPLAWHRLTGMGSVLHVTSFEGALPLQSQGALHVVALIRLDGAENAMLGRLGMRLDAVHPGERVRLASPPDPTTHPAQNAWFLPDTDTP